MIIEGNSGQAQRANVFSMKTMHPLHYSDKPQMPQDDNVAGSFMDALHTALGKVNNLQVDADDLTKKMIHSPGTVEIHTVMIAKQKAEIALTLTKAIRDEAIKAYRELINLR